MSDSENIKANFPFPILPKSPGLPSYTIINEVHTKGKENASSVVSELDGAVNGFLDLTLSPATYLQLSGHHFQRPANPGTIPLNATGMAAQMKEIVHQHKEQIRVHRQIENMELALKAS